MSAEPKPATGEWTGEMVEQMLDAEGVISGIGDIVAAHNAALAAAQGKRGFDRMDMPAPHPLAIKVAQLEEQLAAERKKLEKQTAETLMLAIRADTELAAEREWREQMIDQLETMHKQLATAVELLGECRTKLDWSVTDGAFIERIDAALAKIGGKGQ